MPQWILYTRSGCSLCDEMLGELREALPAAEAARVTLVDIAGDPELERKYSTRIPVLVADGEFVCAYRLDRDRLSLWLT